MTWPSSCLILGSPRAQSLHSLPCRQKVRKRFTKTGYRYLRKIWRLARVNKIVNIYRDLRFLRNSEETSSHYCPPMPRFLRIASLRPRSSPLRVYSTAPVPAKRLVTPEIEKADKAKEVELRTKQAPNRTTTWASSQRPRSDAFDHPRFEGAILELQVKTLHLRLSDWI